ncbi:hypothetical protein [Methylobacterium gnaphalii]|uniref:Terminase n=1 Tax=Methylobacterium gnaphalii TaxID=1010610 RepID=A0A512JNZ6_9HYPH|nr:hypothetical protein [Methylobacterium gnaphalii]GEP11669.1 hypothetical protein MGN01_35140 [Methylobacterium gnaphalii]GJD71355.1 hypothetical protein MMMDOFMJ_4311 [Methylobacterium gnaphalii]GLS50167.1 hypothetical protein GCM10007885_30190 [Methylobacterium gnaphalii]
MAKAKKPIDWAAVEREYCKTDQSIREIARWYGISDKAIRLRAKEKKWPPRGEGAPQATPQAAQSISDAVEPIVERIRTLPADFDASPEAIIGRGQKLAVRMLDELEADTANIGEIEEAIEEANSGKNAARRRDAMLKAVSLSSRAGTLKNLALAAKTFAEASAPDGKKKQRQAAADQTASSGGKFAQRSGPRLVASNP